MELWSEIRRKVLVEGVSKREVCREYKLGWRTLDKILGHVEPPGYRSRMPRALPKLGPFTGVNPSSPREEILTTLQPVIACRHVSIVTRNPGKSRPRPPHLSFDRSDRAARAATPASDGSLERSRGCRPTPKRTRPTEPDDLATHIKEANGNHRPGSWERNRRRQI